MEFHHIYARNKWYCEIYYNDETGQRKIVVGVANDKHDSFKAAIVKYEIREAKVFKPKSYFQCKDLVI